MCLFILPMCLFILPKSDFQCDLVAFQDVDWSFGYFDFTPESNLMNQIDIWFCFLLSFSIPSPHHRSPHFQDPPLHLHHLIQGKKFHNTGQTIASLCSIQGSKSIRAAMAVFPGARLMEEGLAEAIDEGRIGPRDDSKNHIGRENPNWKQVFFATTTRHDVGGGAGGGGVLATTLLDHQSINHTLFNNFPVGNCSSNQRKRGREYGDELIHEEELRRKLAEKKQQHYFVLIRAVKE
ncbi:hypothetical protein Ccrd_000857 [Cynara cardunculus var. scolymus]|uniref:Uncharacterized protein n=1 Tax=Cynara cardunculus var. scolymus TaxID=59895 RepID=A0A103XUE6_CYNCS|nr:hypothetical protein Ccrd_000857 [Cynara cardunculus var. scolymus]